MTALPQWFDEKPFGTQLIVLAAVCDTFGAALGYALHPVLGVEPLVGIAMGLVAGSLPLSAFVLQHAQSESEPEPEPESDDEWGA